MIPEQPQGASVPAFREDSPCAYFEDGRIASLEYVVTDGISTPRRFGDFLAVGYRRLGSLFYHAACTACAACRPIRLEPGLFSPDRGQRRTLKRNDDVRIEIPPSPSVTPEKTELLRKYVSTKHRTQTYTDSLAHGTLLFLHYGYQKTIEMDYYLGNRLIGVGIVDEATDALSSNYFYYDTDYLDRRLGVFSILTEIALARRMGKRYLYLGFYIEETGKMSYKKDFRPNQIYEGGLWKSFCG